ncbi:MAG: hypothetical protein ACE5NG_16085, partial [bacterium]
INYRGRVMNVETVRTTKRRGNTLYCIVTNRADWHHGPYPVVAWAKPGRVDTQCVPIVIGCCCYVPDILRPTYGEAWGIACQPKAAETDSVFTFAVIAVKTYENVIKMAVGKEYRVVIPAARDCESVADNGVKITGCSWIGYALCGVHLETVGKGYQCTGRILLQPEGEGHQ